VDSVEILDAIEVGHASAGENRLNFSPSVWAEINRVHDRECPDLEIVGWYHSHPGWGVALSSDDLPIQNNHFAEKLALVIDTHKRRGAFFAGSGKKGGPFKSEEFVWDQQAVQVMMDMRSASPLADRGRERSALSSREGGHDTSPDIRIIEDELPPGGIDPDVWAGARDAVPEDASAPRRQLVTGRDVLAFLLGMVALVVAQWGGIPLVKYVASVLLSASLEQVLIIAAIAVFLVLIVIFLLFKSGLGRHNEIGE